MPQYLSPGVYVEEVEAGSRPIEGVGTSVAAFVGFAQQGPFDTPTLVSNWGQFTTIYGEFVEGFYLAQAVYGYFLNGGTNCYIVRIGGPRDNGNGQVKALPAGPQATIGGYRVGAKQLPAGAEPQEITGEVADADESRPGDRFTLLGQQNGQVAQAP